MQGINLIVFLSNLFLQEETPSIEILTDELKPVVAEKIQFG